MGPTHATSPSASSPCSRREVAQEPKKEGEMEKPADKEDENKEAKLPEPLVASERKGLTDEEAGKKVEEGEK